MNFSQDDNHVDYYWFTKTNQECQSNLTQECPFTVYKRCTISVHSVSNFCSSVVSSRKMDGLLRHKTMSLVDSKAIVQKEPLHSSDRK